MSKSREDLKTYALLAERAERYNDMLDYVVEMVKLGEGLSEDERSLLSLACKNIISPRRTSCRCLMTLEEKHSKDESKMVCIRELQKIVLDEMKAVCNKLVDTLETYIFPRQNTPSDLVFYNKMAGDYYRYLAETVKDETKGDYAKKALASYNRAYEVATSQLSATNPVRLGLMLNLSVCYYEIEDDVKMAQKIAREALDGAVSIMGDTSGNDFRDSGLIIQLLRDNLTLWGAESAMTNPGEEEEDDKSDASGAKKVEAK